jgi:hypothetical protein
MAPRISLGARDEPRAQDHRSGHLRRAGPGDPGLLTVRAAEALRSAALILLDPDVPAGVASLAEGAAEVRPAIGDPATVAATLVAEARTGSTVAGWSPATRCPPTRWCARCSASPTPACRSTSCRACRSRPACRRTRGCRWLGAHRGRRPRRGRLVRRLLGAGHARAHRDPGHLARSRSRCWSRAVGRHPGLGHRGRHRRGPEVGDHHAGRARAGLGWLSGPLVVTVGPAVTERSGCPGGSPARCTAGRCWSRGPRSRPAR